MGLSKSNIILPQETRKISENLKFCLKQLEKEGKTKPKASRRNKIINNQEIVYDQNHKQTRDQVNNKKRAMKLKPGSLNRKTNKQTKTVQLEMKKEKYNWQQRKTKDH